VNGNQVGVTSSTFGLDEKFPAIGGVHHCKLISPAYVAEWIYTEGLRSKRAPSSITLNYLRRDH
jgi:hypothetical protein